MFGAGEVDFYRLKLTLSQIGKAFLDLDSFINPRLIIVKKSPAFH